jgi:hypothetical protein
MSNAHRDLLVSADSHVAENEDLRARPTFFVADGIETTGAVNE